EGCPCRAHGHLEGFLGNAGHERLDEPTQSCGNVAGEGNGLALDVHAAVFLLKLPVRIDSPEESSVVADGLFALIRCVGIDYLGDSGRVGPAVPARRIYWKIMNVVIGVERDGD